MLLFSRSGFRSDFEGEFHETKDALRFSGQGEGECNFTMFFNAPLAVGSTVSLELGSYYR